MTTHFIDIRLRPDPEFSQAHLLGALYAKLHRVLVRLQFDDIGVSFPQHALKPRTLGNLMRLHGSETALAVLMDSDWLSGMRDHIVLTAPAIVPSQVPHRIVQRRQFKTNVERLRRRRMRRKGETADEARQAVPESVERIPDLPYVQLHSTSTGQAFCLFVDHGPLLSLPSRGKFNAYGLSGQASVPWF